MKTNELAQRRRRLSLNSKESRRRRLRVECLEQRRLLAANLAPENIVPDSGSVLINQPLAFTEYRGNVINVSDPDAGDSPVQVTLEAANGTVSLVTPNPGGTLTYVTGDGTDDALFTLQGSITSINEALSWVVFEPTADYTGTTASITITTDDLGNTGDGGALTDVDVVPISVNPIPDYEPSVPGDTRAGQLDLSFGDNGIKTLALSASVDTIRSISQNNDGSFIAVGAINNRFGILKFDADLELDSSFGTGGWTSTDLGNGQTAKDFIIDTDGSILVVGGAYVTRYTSQGILDQSFGVDGVVSATGFQDVLDVELMPNGNFLITGIASSRFAATQFTPGGNQLWHRTYDPFGGGGDVSTGVFANDDGTLLLFGRTYDGAFTQLFCFGTVTLDNVGNVLDTNAGTATGVSNGYIHHTMRDIDGGFTMAGRATPTADTSSGTIARKSSSGESLQDFGNQGSTQISPIDDLVRVDRQSDGKIVSVGSNWTNGNHYLTRLSVNGHLDNTFGSNGVIQLPTSFVSSSTAVDNMDRIIAAGRTNDEIVLVRYLGDTPIEYDYGDAPAPYPVTFKEDGARHGERPLEDGLWQEFSPNDRPNAMDSAYVDSNYDGSVVSVTNSAAEACTMCETKVFLRDSNAEWLQLGQTIIYEDGDHSSLSANGSRIAVGSAYAPTQIFDLQENTWVPVGTSMPVDGRPELSGDGNTLAVGDWTAAPSGPNSGRVIVYRFIAGEWTQLGQEILGTQINQYTGDGIALSHDGNVLAVNSPHTNGFTSIYSLSGDSWVLKGSVINAIGSSDRPLAVDLSADGSRVVIGAYANDSFATNAGNVRVFDFDGSDWVQVGSTLTGQAANDEAGWVSLSDDGNSLAMGFSRSDTFGNDVGKVLSYRLNGLEWVQFGQPISGDGDLTRFGRHIALSGDGKSISVGNGPLRTFDLVTTPQLGSTRTREANGIHSDLADADTDDGVTFGELRVGQTDATVTVNVQNAPLGAKLDAWIDFNGDGNWGGPQEHIFDSVDVVNGDNQLQFRIPGFSISGDAYARFRLGTDGDLGIGGEAVDGEVEDYVLDIIQPIPSMFHEDIYKVLAENQSEVVAFATADLDSDGDEDLIFSTNLLTKSLNWLENKGSDGFVTHVIATGGIDSYVVIPLDLDSDGDMDLAVADKNQNAGLNLYINDGQQQFTVSKVFSLGLNRLTAIDIDGDGDTDFGYTSFNSDRFGWLENQGGLVFQEHVIATDVDGPESIDFADVDMDGDLDVVVAGFYSNNVKLYLNAGDINFIPSFTASINSPRMTRIIDFDNDGLFDLIASSEDDSKIGVYRNLSGGEFQYQHLADVSNYKTAGVADFNLDGRWDLYSGISTASPWSSGIFTQTADGTVDSAPLITFSGSQLNVFREAIPLDFDGDGDLDLAASYYHTVVLHEANSIPTVNSISDLIVDEDFSEQTVDVTGITAGGSEVQPLRVTAISGDLNLIPDPTVTYTSANESGSLSFTPIQDAFGTTTITVTVEDGGLDLDLATTADNAMFSRTFDVTVNPVNDSPTLDEPADLTIDEDAAEQTVDLAGITAGGGESQPLRVTASSSNTGLILNPTVTYTSADATGTLKFTPVADQSGVSTITVTVEDGGLDGDLATAGDNLSFSRTFDVTVNAVNDAPTLDSISSLTIDEDAAQQIVNLAGISSGGGESQPLRVTAASGNTGLIPNPTVIYTSADATGTLQFIPLADQSGATTITVTVEDGGLDLDLATTEDNATFSRTFDVTINSVNDSPTLDTLTNHFIDEDAAQQTVDLAGITAGGGESQPLRVTASSSDTALILNPTVIYTSADATGTLQFIPLADQSGAITITVTVEDGGLDGDLATAGDNLSFSRTFDVTVNAVNDDPTVDAGVGTKLSIDQNFANKGLGQRSGSVRSRSFLMNDGRIAVTGWASLSSGSERTTIDVFLADGQPDSSVGTNGRIQLDLVGRDMANGFSEQRDGKWLVTGTANYGNADDDWSVSKLLPNGSLDLDFAVNGTFVFDNGSTKGGEGHSSVELNDGSVIVTGGLAWGKNLGVLRLNSDGTRDMNFGGNGLVEINLGNLSGPSVGYSRIFPNTDGTFWVSSSNGYQSGIPRSSHLYLMNDAGEIIATHTAPLGDDARTDDMIRDEQGRFVCVAVDGTDLVITRQLSDGRLDLGFGTNGIRRHAGVASVKAGQGISVLPNGRLLVGYLFDNYQKLSLRVVGPDGGFEQLQSGTDEFIYDYGRRVGGDHLWLDVMPLSSGDYWIGTWDLNGVYDYFSVIVKDPLILDEDSGLSVIPLRSITAGGGENQPLRVTAISENVNLIPDPTVNYTSSEVTGSLSFAPAADQYGNAMIKVTVEDGGLDGDLGTLADNATFTRTFDVTVDAVNDAPTLDSMSNLTIDEDATEQTVILMGISAGGGESQPLRVTASSSNTGLILNPTVTYTSADATGTLKFTPVADQSGVSTITVTVEDGGLDGDLATGGDNLSFSRTFDVTVNAVNDAPTLDSISSLTIDEDAAEQTVNLAGISSGGGESQPLRVTAASGNIGLIPIPIVTYTSAEATGTLQFIPLADQSGATTITVTVEDGGLDGDLATAGDNLSFSRTFDVTVNAVNDAPTLDSISSLTIDEDAAQQTVNLAGISSGGGESQPLRVTAASGNTGLIPNPTVIYTSADATGTLQFIPLADQSGAITITVTVEDGGLDGDLATAGDNLSFSRTFDVTVNAVNDAPTLDSISSLTIDEDAAEQTVNLAGISSGGGESQPLRVTAASGNTGLIPNPTVIYTSADATGTLQFIPIADQSGVTTITVTVEDGGLDGDLATAGDNLSFSRTFDVTVNAVNDAPTLDSISSLTIDEDAAQQTVNLAGISSGGGESQPLRVTAASGNTGLIPNPTVIYTSADATGTLQFIPIADQSGVTTITVTVEDGGLDLDLATTEDNATFSRTFDVTVNPVNDIPTLDELADLTIDEDAAEQTVSLTGVSAGGGESQPLRVTASSNNTGLIADPIVTYTSADATASLAFRPITDQFGTATITVTVEDAGLDGDLATTEDNVTLSRSLDIMVNPVNDAPLLDSLPDVVIDEDGVVHGNGTNVKLFASDIDSDESKLEFRIVNLAEIDPQFGLSIGMDQQSESFASRADNTIHVHPAANFFGSTQVLIEARDPEGDVSNQRIFSLIINAVNDPPVLDPASDLSLSDLVEDSGSPVGPVGSLVSSIIDENGPLSNYSDIDGIAPGIAVVGKNIAVEKIWFSTDDGQNWQEVGSVSDAESLVLKADATTRVYLQTADDVSGQLADALTIRAWDQTGGYSNGQLGVDSTAIAFSSQTDTVSLSVEPSPSSAADDFYAPLFDGVETFVISKADLLANDTLGNGESIDTVTITADVTSVAGGTISVDGDDFTYTRPANWFSGIDTFGYTLDDGGSTSNATVTILSGLQGDTLTITLEPGRDHDVTLRYSDEKLVLMDHVTQETLLNIPKGLVPANVDVIGAPANSNIVTFSELSASEPSESSASWSYQGGTANDELAVLGSGSQWAWLSSDPQIENDVTVELKLFTTLIDSYTMIAVEKVSVGQVDRVEIFDPYLQVESSVLELGSNQPFNLPNSTVINGGQIISATPVGLHTAESIVGSGQIDAVFAGGVGSLIRLSGDLAIGDANSPAGFRTDGFLEVGANTVTLLDSNQAELGSLTTLGDALPGTLVSTHGLILEFGDNLEGYGTIQTDADGTVINNGNIIGTSSEQPITINSRVKGVGTFDNVVMNGEFTPGFSPTLWKSGTVAYTDLNRFVIELGGRLAGAEFDRVEHYLAKLGGTLDVQLIDGFKPALGDLFEVITSEQPFEGDFSEVRLPLRDNGVRVRELLGQHGIELETVFDVANTLEVLKSQVADYQIAGHDGSGLKVQGDRFRAFVTSLHQFAAEHPWHTEQLEVEAGKLVQIATDGVNRLMIEGSNWKNFVEPSDVNNDQNVTALDALTVINELGRRSHSDDLTSKLNDATILVTGEGHFYDQNGDGKCTALDALRVINDLARSSVSGEGESLTADYLSGRSDAIWSKDMESNEAPFESEYEETDLIYSDADPETSNASDRPEDLVYATVGQESTEAVDSLLSDLEDWWK